MPPILGSLMEVGFFDMPAWDHMLSAVRTWGKRTVGVGLRIERSAEADDFALFHHALSRAVGQPGSCAQAADNDPRTVPAPEPAGRWAERIAIMPTDGTTVVRENPQAFSMAHSFEPGQARRSPRQSQRAGAKFHAPPINPGLR